MPDFSKEELNLIFLYDPGNLSGLIYELRAMMNVLMPDEKELRDLTKGTIDKLTLLNREDYKRLCESQSPDLGLHFDLGLPSEMTDITDETED
jgi:hypothetical protein